MSPLEVKQYLCHSQLFFYIRYFLLFSHCSQLGLSDPSDHLAPILGASCVGALQIGLPEGDLPIHLLPALGIDYIEMEQLADLLLTVLHVDDVQL